MSKEQHSVLDESEFGFNITSRMTPITYVVDKDNCWIPNMRLVSRKWYPSNKKQILIYRYLYWLFNNKTVESLNNSSWNSEDEIVINHKCKKGHLNCINPEHLETITRVENIKYSMNETKQKVSDTQKGTVKEYCRGTNSLSNILTEDEATDIILMYSFGYKVAYIHKKYNNVSYNTVRLITIGKKWKYLYDKIKGGNLNG